jgi:ABC-type sugar transport system ATPase subunit
VLADVSGSGDVLLSAKPYGAALIELRSGEAIGLAGPLGSDTGRMLRRLFGTERERSKHGERALHLARRNV